MTKVATVLIATCILIIAVLFVLLLGYRDVPSEAAAAFLGVLVGGLITGSVQYFTSQAERGHQLRMAALEKRLQAHQEAFALWRRLLFADRMGPETPDMVVRCEEWWEANCLYLAPLASEAFQKAFRSASDHAALLATHADARLLKDAAADVRRTGQIIVESASLPSIGDVQAVA